METGDFYLADVKQIQQTATGKLLRCSSEEKNLRRARTVSKKSSCSKDFQSELILSESDLIQTVSEQYM